jgi:hypothetical protein
VENLSSGILKKAARKVVTPMVKICFKNFEDIGEKNCGEKLESEMKNLKNVLYESCQMKLSDNDLMESIELMQSLPRE